MKAIIAIVAACLCAACVPSSAAAIAKSYRSVLPPHVVGDKTGTVDCAAQGPKVKAFLCGASYPICVAKGCCPFDAPVICATKSVPVSAGKCCEGDYPICSGGTACAAPPTNKPTDHDVVVEHDVIHTAEYDMIPMVPAVSGTKDDDAGGVACDPALGGGTCSAAYPVCGGITGREPACCPAAAPVFCETASSPFNGCCEGGYPICVLHDGKSMCAKTAPSGDGDGDGSSKFCGTLFSLRTVP